MEYQEFITKFENGLISNEEIKKNVLEYDVELKYYFIKKELFFEELVKDEFWLIRYEIAKRGKCLDILVFDENDNVKEQVAKHGFGLDILVKDNHWRVKVEVARQGFGLDILKNDVHYLVRREVASQGYGLDILVNDEDDYVSEEAEYQLNIKYRDYISCKWDILITNDNLIIIGCKTKTLDEWKTFFQKKEHYTTIPYFFPVEYQKIVDGFNKAKDFLNS